MSVICIEIGLVTAWYALASWLAGIPDISFFGSLS